MTTGKFLNGLFLGVAALVAAAPAAAQGTGALTSKIELEKVAPAAEGADRVTTYVEPDVVVPGDRVRVTLTFANHGSAPASGINITNPIPDGLVFDGTADRQNFSVSVDGAKTFGALEALTVAVPDADTRPATNADVTHVRWIWSDAIGVHQSRSVAFFARVK